MKTKLLPILVGLAAVTASRLPLLSKRCVITRCRQCGSFNSLYPETCIDDSCPTCGSKEYHTIQEEIVSFTI